MVEAPPPVELTGWADIPQLKEPGLGKELAQGHHRLHNNWLKMSPTQRADKSENFNNLLKDHALLDEFEN